MSSFPFVSCNNNDDISYITEGDCVQRTQVKLDFQNKMIKRQLDIFATVINESILNQNKENEKFRKLIEESVNAHFINLVQQLRNNSDKIHLLETEVIRMRKNIEILQCSFKKVNDFNDFFS
jgi:hypothetical protein